MTPPLPKPLKICPITPNCRFENLYDIGGELFFAGARDGQFKRHHCRSDHRTIPTTFFVAEWFNLRTQRTRFMAPTLVKANAARANPEGNRNREDWQLVQIHRASDISWEVVPTED